MALFTLSLFNQTDINLFLGIPVPRKAFDAHISRKEGLDFCEFLDSINIVSLRSNSRDPGSVNNFLC